jgi:hypothetical protein
MIVRCIVLRLTVLLNLFPSPGFTKTKLFRKLGLLPSSGEIRTKDPHLLGSLLRLLDYLDQAAHQITVLSSSFLLMTEAEPASETL